MNPHYTYFLILAGSLLGPLMLSFDKKVAFYKTAKHLFPAMLFPAIFYIVWDIVFTQMGVWYFNEAYITGIMLKNLPIEEVLFFFVVPYCCVFIYECMRCYFPSLKNSRTSERILQGIAVFLFITSLFFYDRYYTFYTFLFCSVFIAVIFLFRNYFIHFNITIFLVAYAVILIPFLVVNGFLTDIPVVLYNDAENLGIRIYTIPVEDAIYGMLLVMMNITILERLRRLPAIVEA